jgi:segregation and condensation protein A
LGHCDGGLAAGTAGSEKDDGSGTGGDEAGFSRRASEEAIRRSRELRHVGIPSAYKVQLPIYEGPLDLLLDLIRQQEIDIYDIPIAKITAQYLDYLHRLEQLNIDIAGEFILMAATLIHIKSRMLLPPDPMAGPEAQMDPRMELVQRLLEHEKFKQAAQMLHEKQQIEAHVWTKPDLSLYQVEEEQGEIAVSLFDLVRVFREVLERVKEAPTLGIEGEQVTVTQMVEALRRQLLAGREPVSLTQFLSSCKTRQAMIVAFLAVLELVRLQAVVLMQAKSFGDILLRKHRMFDSVFSGEGRLMPSIEESYL